MKPEALFGNGPIFFKKSRKLPLTVVSWIEKATEHGPQFARGPVLSSKAVRPNRALSPLSRGLRKQGYQNPRTWVGPQLVRLG